LTGLEIIEKSINLLHFLKDFAEIPLTPLLHFMPTVYVYKKGNATPVTGREGL
jgi:hypothetical protein